MRLRVGLGLELEKRGLMVARQQGVPDAYEGVQIHSGFIADMIVEDQIIVEIKAVEGIAPVHISRRVRRGAENAEKNDDEC